MSTKDNKLTPKQLMFIDIFENNATNISQACKKVGINRATYYDWVDKSDTFKKRIDEAKEGMIDFAESMLFKNMKAGNPTSIIFFLKTKGRSRGYVEYNDQTEESKDEVVPTVVNIVLEDRSREDIKIEKEVE